MPSFKNYDVVVFCVAHKKFKGINFSQLPIEPHYFDINMVLDNKIKKQLKQKNLKSKLLAMTRTAIITGGAGFIGLHLCRELIKKNLKC